MVCKWQVEIDDYATRVLEKHWPDVRRWRDVRTFPPPGDWSVDVICGGFPCQDISIAGRGAGIEGERSGLWKEMFRIVCLLRPKVVVVENVAAILDRGMDTLLIDFASLGFNAEWSIIPCCAMGAPHSRERMFLVAYADEVGLWSWRDRVPDYPRFDYWEAAEGQCEWSDVELWLRETFQNGDWGTSADRFQRMDDGFSQRVAIGGLAGNAVCPQVAEWIGHRIVAALTE